MSPGAAFVVGLFGSVHCVGMCGGLLAASRATPGRKYLVRERNAAIGWVQNAGRILSYGLLGAIAGTLGGVVDRGLQERGRLVLSVLALVVLLWAALNMLGWLPARLSLERMGGPLWRRIEPYARALLPVRTKRGALAFGLLWGFLPCGLVYSTLTLAVSAGDPLRGALTMLAFGAGTAPALLGLGELLTRVRVWPRVAGVTLLAFAALQGVSLVKMTNEQPHACCTHHEAR